MKNNTRLTLTSYLFFFLVGFFINIGGAVTGALAESLATGTAVIGYSFSAFMAGRFLGITSNSLLLKKKKLNKNVYIRLSSTISLASIAGLGFTKNAWMLAIFLFIAGIGIGLQYSISNLILVDLYSGQKKAFHISMVNFLYSAGSICSPFLTGVLLNLGFHWLSPYLGYAILLIFAIILLSRTDYKNLFLDSTENTQDSGKMTKDHALICFAIVLYILAEFSITFWTPVYMKEALGKNTLFAGACVSTFWIAVLIGRLLTGFILRYIKSRTFILIAGILAVLSLFTMWRITSNVILLPAMFMCGFFCAGLFPAIFTFGTDFSESLKRTFPTFMMLSAATGSFLAMPMGSLVKNIVGVVWMPLVPAIAIALTCLLILITRPTPKNQ